MITLRVNVIALILAGLTGGMFLTLATNVGYDRKEVVFIAIATFATIRVYDYIAGLPAFRGGNKNKGKDGGK